MRQRKPGLVRLSRLLIARGWRIRSCLPKKGERSLAWDFYRDGNELVALNSAADCVLRDFEQCWRDHNWPPEWSASRLATAVRPESV
jgi:hypothetical protein